jgi:hypothetical protein
VTVIAEMYTLGKISWYDILMSVVISDLDFHNISSPFSKLIGVLFLPNMMSIFIKILILLRSPTHWTEYSVKLAADDFSKTPVNVYQ